MTGCFNYDKGFHNQTSITDISNLIKKTFNPLMLAVVNSPQTASIQNTAHTFTQAVTDHDRVI